MMAEHSPNQYYGTCHIVVARAAKRMNRGGRASSPRFTSLAIVCCDDAEQGYPGRLVMVRARGRPCCACNLIKPHRRGKSHYDMKMSD